MRKPSRVGILLVMAYTRRLCPKGIPLSDFRYNNYNIDLATSKSGASRPGHSEPGYTNPG